MQLWYYLIASISQFLKHMAAEKGRWEFTDMNLL